MLGFLVINLGVVNNGKVYKDKKPKKTMEANIEKIIQECEGPRFLGHFICSGDSNRRDDLKIFNMLTDKEKVYYSPSPKSDSESFLSLSPWTMDRGWMPLMHHGERQGQRQGLIIFNESFYDKICSWHLSDPEVLSMYHQAESRFNDQITGPGETGSKVYLRAINGVLALRTPSRIRKVEEVLDRREGSIRNKIMNFGHQTRNPYLKHIVEVFADFDIGVRAVHLTSEGNIGELPYSREDIKYLISWGDNEKKPKILIKP